MILGGSDSGAALEVAVQVALVGEAAGGGGLGDRLAGFEQAPGAADPVRELQRMGRQTGVLAEEADEAELADPGGSGELFEADVAFGLVGEEIPGQAQRLVVAGAERRSRSPLAGPADALPHAARLDAAAGIDLGFPATFIRETSPWVFGAASLPG